LSEHVVFTVRSITAATAILLGLSVLPLAVAQTPASEGVANVQARNSTRSPGLSTLFSNRTHPGNGTLIDDRCSLDFRFLWVNYIGVGAPTPSRCFTYLTVAYKVRNRSQKSFFGNLDNRLRLTTSAGKSYPPDSEAAAELRKPELQLQVVWDIDKMRVRKIKPRQEIDSMTTFKIPGDELFNQEIAVVLADSAKSGSVPLYNEFSRENLEQFRREMAECQRSEEHRQSPAGF
jgi:hypothetical protein